METKNRLTIVIGGNIKSDYKALFSKKSLAEIKQQRNILYLHSYEQMDKLLSPKKLDLLLYLIEQQSGEKPLSITEIAEKLNRAQTAISRDVNYLKKMGLVTLKQFKQTVYAFSLYSGVAIKMGNLNNNF